MNSSNYYHPQGGRPVGDTIFSAKREIAFNAISKDLKFVLLAEFFLVGLGDQLVSDVA